MCVVFFVLFSFVAFFFRGGEGWRRGMREGGRTHKRKEA